ncbi:acyltransferase [Macrococcus brunensis]|uniref:Acyltransferase n=1 Tax=Macrococcus brunensis TaxID=198483 RepID=A0A4R6BAT0_9STAP|nr:acyltransferase family protein [Macrococcus brunensis]TDL93397.1 acyltransferase [Macrococcus brunensis]
MKNKKILEIESLRIIVALLVAIYHIWMHKVSGGVDVFFVITGFLITKSLISTYDRTNTVQPVSFVQRLLKRLYPHIAIVIAFVVVTFSIISPQLQLKTFLLDIFASATYLQNWALISQYNSYIGSIDSSSIFKHLWATSVQGQFYVIWSALFLLLIKLTSKKSSILRTVLMIAFITIFVLSLIFSIYLTAVNQQNAYYNTFTRLFEFAAGAIMCLVYSKISVSKGVSNVFSIIGVFMILTMGLFLNIENLFPGYVALLPVLSVLLVLISTRSNEQSMFNQLLTNKYILALAPLAYPFYLWHWIVYVYSSIILQKKEFNIIEGFLIIIGGLLLAHISHLIIKNTRRRLPILGLMALAASLVIISNQTIQYQQIKDLDLNKKIAEDAYLEDTAFRGALDYQKQQQTYTDLKPAVNNAKHDIGTLYNDNCNQIAKKDEVISCDYGNRKSELKVALVGGSHTVQWFDPIKIIAEQRGFHLKTYTKLGCRFTAEKLKDQACVNWNQNVLKSLKKDQIDLVITNADINSPEYPTIPTGYLQQFKELKRQNINVIAFRDTPWFKKDTLKCVKENSDNVTQCQSDKNEVLSKEDKWLKMGQKPDNVTYADFTPVLCPNGKCSVVQGNVLMYWDSHHLTESYTKTMTLHIDEVIVQALNEL